MVYLRGAALLLMMIHHLIGFPEWIADENKIIDEALPVLYNAEHIFANRFGKICVSMFTFFAGFGLSVREDKYRHFRSRAEKVLDIFASYWIIQAVYLIFGIAAGEPMPTISELILNIFSLGTGTPWTNGVSHINVSFAWYLTFYGAAVLAFPAIVKFLCRGFVRDSIFAVLFMLLSGAVFHIILGRKNETLYTLEMCISVYIPVFMAGYIINRYDIFEKAEKLLPRFKTPAVYILAIAVTVSAKLVLDDFWIVNSLDIIYIPVLVFALIKAASYLRLPKPARTCAYAVGRYSLEIWLLSGIFFTPDRTLQWLAYLPKVGAAAVIWSILLLMPAAVGIRRLIGLIKKNVLSARR